MNQHAIALERITNTKQDLLFVTGVPGSGKTTLGSMLSNQWADRSTLYLSFGRENTNASMGKLHPNTKCFTFHGFAFSQLGIDKNRIVPSISIRLIVKHFEQNHSINIPLNYAEAIRDLIECYSISAGRLSDVKRALSKPNFTCHLSREAKGEVFSLFRTIWLDVTDKAIGPTTHNIYLKHYASQSRKVYFSKVIVDESQDLTPVMWQLVEQMRSTNSLQVVSLGDPSQQINRYMGASSRLDQEKPCAALTQTHRFGQSVCAIANHLMESTCAPNYEAMHSTHDSTNVSGYGSFDSLLSRAMNANTRFTYLARYNATLWYIMIKLATQNVRFSIIGKINKNELTHIEKLYDFSKGSPKYRKHFHASTYLQYKNELEMSGQKEKLQFCKVIDAIRSNSDIPFSELFSRLKRNLQSNARQAQVLLSTVHQAKGLEFGNVVLSNDFPHVDTIKKGSDELNILFTAITRVKHNLYLNKNLAELFIPQTQKPDTRSGFCSHPCEMRILALTTSITHP